MAADDLFQAVRSTGHDEEQGSDQGKQAERLAVVVGLLCGREIARVSEGRWSVEPGLSEVSTKVARVGVLGGLIEARF